MGVRLVDENQTDPNGQEFGIQPLGRRVVCFTWNAEWSKVNLDEEFAGKVLLHRNEGLGCREEVEEESWS